MCKYENITLARSLNSGKHGHVNFDITPLKMSILMVLMVIFMLQMLLLAILAVECMKVLLLMRLTPAII